MEERERSYLRVVREGQNNVTWCQWCSHTTVLL